MSSVGVLALQGDFAEHLAVLRSIGCRCGEVRTVQDLDAFDALIIPGGESTTMLKFIDRYDLRDPLVKRVNDGMAVFGTCAGAILLADEVSDGEDPLGVLRLGIERNAYGSQLESFETDIDIATLDGGAVKAVFIRAPVITNHSADAEVLARLDDRPILVRDGNILVSTFHPELVGEERIHRWFISNFSKGDA
ncbi:MAG: pyridoxal 5'-phosphate synthase glutaminase subunit PdxT [Actinobacteria bacterium]|nr:pyridoxal 5'-phosphate synthase glutaminase subunit PdxT [Actinomycetota bacterium]